MNTLLQSLQAKVETQSHATEVQTQERLNDFEQHLSQALNDVQQKIMQDMRDLEKLSEIAGVLLTFWVLLMAVQLTFPRLQNTTPEPGLAMLGLEGARLSRGPGGLGRVLSLPRGVTLADCPIPNLNGGEVCVETATTR